MIELYKVWGVVMLSGTCFVFLLMGWVVHLNLNSVQGPYGVVTVPQCFG